MADLTIAARYYGPAFAAGEPRQIVIHSVESDIVPGLAASLARGWFRNPGNETSAHSINDPRDSVTMVPDTVRAWHCGNGNATSLGDEHTGRAAFSRAQWTTPDGLAMLRNSARYVAREATKLGIPARWLTLSQLAANEKGLCTHNDMRLVRGGTTHTDPGPGFPYDLYLQYVKESMGEKPATDVRGSYTVRPGDTLTGIASRTKTTVEDLVRWNGIRNPDVIVPGQVLKLSGGVTSSGGQSVPKPKPALKPYTPPPGPFGLPRGHYYGLITDPAQSHGGYYANERPAVKWIQVRMQQLGYAPTNPGWADGKFEQPTKDAVAKWQRARHASTTSRYGEVWADDWANLQRDR